MSAQSDLAEGRPDRSSRRGVIRSIAVIVIYSLVGPLLGAGFLIGISPPRSPLRFIESIGLALYAAPLVGIFAYPAGIIPASFSGALMAMIFSDSRRFKKYVIVSSIIGMLSSAALCFMIFGIGLANKMKFTCAGLFASFILGIATYWL